MIFRRPTDRMVRVSQKYGLDLDRLRAGLERMYVRYNKREHVEPDPLQFLYGYDDPLDRELVGLIASSLAYGRVQQILKSVALVLGELGARPRARLLGMSAGQLRRTFRDFRHRFTGGAELSTLLLDLQSILKCHGSLNACFLAGYGPVDETVLPGLRVFAGRFSCKGTFLVPDPGGGSAFKRMCLFLRWMVRSDAVDPGGWVGIPASALLVPLDTHIFRLSRELGLTARRTANVGTVLEIASGFRAICPDDPARYDFVLTRLGIQPELFGVGSGIAVVFGGE